MHFYCPRCGAVYPVASLAYRCGCGGLFQLSRQPGEELPRSVSLGEGPTPLLRRDFDGLNLALKLDYLLPTGSFKDRGAAAIVNVLAVSGIRSVVEDSSGNAGAAIAAYCAAAGIRCRIYVPESTSPGKLKQIAAYGASIIPVPGTRDDTARAVQQAAQATYYASHVYNPLFLEGVKSFAHELHAAIGIPDYLFLPVGNGSLLLGAYLGFAAIGSLPRIIGVQSARCAPLYHAARGETAPPAEPTLAEGIAVASPPRAAEIIAAVRRTGGEFITVTEAEIGAAAEKLGRLGLYVESTAAAAVAGARRYFAGRPVANLQVAVPLTGTGLKK